MGGERSAQEVFVDDALANAESDPAAKGAMSANGPVLGVKPTDVPVGAGDEDEESFAAGDRVPRRWGHCFLGAIKWKRGGILGVLMVVVYGVTTCAHEEYKRGDSFWKQTSRRR